MADSFLGKLRGRTGQVQIPTAKVAPNPYQPRLNFQDEELLELAQSIKTHGLLQPIVVTKSAEKPGEYILVAGERRLRAAKIAGLEEIQAVVGVFDEQAMAEMALVENIQRKDLTPIEEARAYKELIDRFGFTQHELGVRLGKNQSTIANKLRLLTLPEEVHEYISREILTERHARALLRLEPETIVKVAEEVVQKGLTVKQTEQVVATVLEEGPKDSRRQRVVRVFKDARLFRNSVLKLVKDMEAGGAKVQVSEETGADNYTITINISKR